MHGCPFWFQSTINEFSATIRMRLSKSALSVGVLKNANMPCFPQDPQHPLIATSAKHGHLG
jgi:hypothetical protein